MACFRAILRSIDVPAYGIRIGKENVCPRPIKIVFMDPKSKLKGSNIKINRDLTVMQRG